MILALAACMDSWQCVQNMNAARLNNWSHALLLQDIYVKLFFLIQCVFALLWGDLHLILR